VVSVQSSKSVASDLDALAQRIIAGGDVTPEEALSLLRLEIEDLPDLFSNASRIRQAFLGNRAHVCAIVNVRSGACPENCAFCAQSAHARTAVNTYKMLSDKEVHERVKAILERIKPSSIGLVASGRSTADEALALAGSVKGLLDANGVGFCGSFGCADAKAAEELKKAGVAKYNHNLETSREFFSQVCTTHTFEDRLNTIRALKASGLSLCVGGIFGMGESDDDRVSLAFELKRLGVNSAPINFLNPVPGTRLGNLPKLNPLEALKIVAMFRFVLPERHIKVAGGREVVLGDFQSWLFLAGGSGFIIGDYLTTKGRSVEDDLRMIENLGLEIE